jgi:hypothetical protein
MHPLCPVTYTRMQSIPMHIDAVVPRSLFPVPWF